MCKKQPEARFPNADKGLLIGRIIAEEASGAKWPISGRAENLISTVFKSLLPPGSAAILSHLYLAEEPHEPRGRADHRSSIQGLGAIHCSPLTGMMR